MVSIAIPPHSAQTPLPAYWMVVAAALKANLPDCGQTFAFMYSIEDPVMANPTAAAQHKSSVQINTCGVPSRCSNSGQPVAVELQKTIYALNHLAHPS